MKHIIHCDSRHDSEMFKKLKEAVEYLHQTTDGSESKYRSLHDTVQKSIDENAAPEIWTYTGIDDEDVLIITRRRHAHEHNKDLLAWKTAKTQGTKKIIITDSTDLTPTATDEILLNKNNVTQLILIRDGIILHRSQNTNWTSTQKRVIETVINQKISGHDLVCGVDWSGGRPPIGTKAYYGELRAADNYDEVRKTLQRYVDDDITQKQASKKLDCAPATITNAADKTALYQLDVRE